MGVVIPKLSTQVLNVLELPHHHPGNNKAVQITKDFSDTDGARLASVHNESAVCCPVPNCEKTVKAVKDLRSHIARHILLGDIPPWACGWCGSTSSGCQVSVSKATGTEMPVTNPEGQPGCCPRFVKFSLKAAADENKLHPCTQRPMPCALCPNPTGKASVYIWKYAMQSHYNLQHHQRREHTDMPKECQISSKEWRSLTGTQYNVRNLLGT